MKLLIVEGIPKRLRWDGKSEKRDPLYNIFIDSDWKLMLFHIENKSFYFAFVFLASQRSYIMYVIDAEDGDPNKYIAKVWIQEVFKENPERRDYFVQVTPIEEVISNLDTFLPSTNYIVIPYEDMKKFFAITLNEEDAEYPNENGRYTICMPIQVENVKRINEDNTNE